MIPRKLAFSIKDSVNLFPVCAIIGSRQVGKTTLAKAIGEEVFPGQYVLLDLENPQDLNRLIEPQIYFARHRNQLIIIDEIQRKPDLFSLIRFLVDQGDYHFLILGSAAPALMKQSSESLAGRIEYLELTPFYLEEIGNDPTSLDSLWLRGGYPRSYLAQSDEESFRWRNAFTQTFLERDLPQLGIKISASQLRRFWQMNAHFHGQIWNGQKIAQSLDISAPTVKNYLGILEQTFILRVLQPYENNLKKRLIKSPKVYFRDSGLLHQSLDILTIEGLMGHTVIGSSWEGFVIEQIIRSASNFSKFYFYRTSGGAEVDLVELLPNKDPIIYEIKYSLSPKTTKGLYSSIKDLNPSKVFLVYPGKESYPIDSGIEVLSIFDIKNKLR